MGGKVWVFATNSWFSNPNVSIREIWVSGKDSIHYYFFFQFLRIFSSLNIDGKSFQLLPLLKNLQSIIFVSIIFVVHSFSFFANKLSLRCFPSITPSQNFCLILLVSLFSILLWQYITEKLTFKVKQRFLFFGSFIFPSSLFLEILLFSSYFDFFLF